MNVNHDNPIKNAIRKANLQVALDTGALTPETDWLELCALGGMLNHLLPVSDKWQKFIGIDKDRGKISSCQRIWAAVPEEKVKWVHTYLKGSLGLFPDVGVIFYDSQTTPNTSKLTLKGCLREADRIARSSGRKVLLITTVTLRAKGRWEKEDYSDYVRHLCTTVQPDGPHFLEYRTDTNKNYMLLFRLLIEPFQDGLRNRTLLNLTDSDLTMSRDSLYQDELHTKLINIIADAPNGISSSDIRQQLPTTFRFASVSSKLAFLNWKGFIFREGTKYHLTVPKQIEPMVQAETEEWISVKHAAELSGFTESLIHGYLNRKLLKHKRLDKPKAFGNEKGLSRIRLLLSDLVEVDKNVQEAVKRETETCEYQNPEVWLSVNQAKKQFGLYGSTIAGWRRKNLLTSHVLIHNRCMKGDSHSSRVRLKVEDLKKLTAYVPPPEPEPEMKPEPEPKPEAKIVIESEPEEYLNDWRGKLYTEVEEGKQRTINQVKVLVDLYTQKVFSELELLDHLRVIGGTN